MPLLRPTGNTWRPPSIGKVAVVSPWRGKLRVQAWPRKRGLPKEKRSRARLHYFRLIQKAIKLLQAQEIIPMRAAVERHNRTHRGQRGAAAIRFRDWQHQRMAGRGFAFYTPDGITFYPPGVRVTASNILDHTWLPGEQLLVKKATEWQGLKPGAAGQVLTAQGPGNPPAWTDL